MFLPAFELRNPLKRRTENDAELFLCEPALFSELRDAPSNVRAHALGIRGWHVLKLPLGGRTINKVIA